MIKLLVLNMSARIANMSDVKVSNKFPRGSKCDQTFTIERVCSVITIIIKVQVLTNFASGGKMWAKTVNLEQVCPDGKLITQVKSQTQR